MTDQTTEPTAAIEVWARMLCAADAHVYGEHPKWQELSDGRRAEYRAAACWLIPRLTVTPPAPAVLPATTNHDTDTGFELRGDTETRAAALREAAERLSAKAYKLTEGLHDLAHFVAKDRLREAEILDREAAELRRVADETAATETDTLPSWLHWRFGPHGQPWAEVPDDDKLLWEHQARAVRRAVARGGFKQPAAGARQAEPVAVPCVECDHPETDHGEGEDPVTPGRCRTCPEDDAWHDYRAATGARQDGAQS